MEPAGGRSLSERTCECGCGASLAEMRSDALFRSRACAMRAKRAASANKGRTRRPSRDGRGVRVYLTAEDFNAEGRIGLSGLRKVRVARQRLKGAG
jgi:hypothetical protein